MAGAIEVDESIEMLRKCGVTPFRNIAEAVIRWLLLGFHDTIICRL